MKNKKFAIFALLIGVFALAAISDCVAQSGVYVGGHIRRERPATITKLKASGFQYVILFNVHVEPDGSLSTDGDTICRNGQYVFAGKHPYYIADIKSLKTPPTSIERIEICIGGWGNTSYKNIKQLHNANAMGANSVLYRNFQALKEAIPEIDAVNNDTEDEYDVNSAVAFHLMMAELGYKTTLAPYTNKSYWTGLIDGINQVRTGVVERVLIQCYGGGAGNNPSDWHIADIPLHAGRENYQNFSETQTVMQDWKANKNVSGGFFWVYNDESWDLNKYATAVNRIFGASNLNPTATHITDRAGLEAINLDLNGSYILDNDVDLSGANWTPLGEAGTNGTGFSGTLDGNGHVIFNMTIDMTQDGTAFFTKLQGSAVVKNLGFENASVTNKTQSRTAILAGYLFGGAVIENCYIANSTILGRWCVGSFVGRARDLTDSGTAAIRNCYSSATIYHASENNDGRGMTGGIIGNIFDGNKIVVENCYFSGIIQKVLRATEANGEGNIAGIVGWIGQDGNQAISGYTLRNNVNLASYLLSNHGKHRISSTRSDDVAVNDPTPGPNYSLSTTVVSGYNDWGNTSAAVASGTTTSKDGANIPGGDANAKAKNFYQATLGWIFSDSTWAINDGSSYPYLAWAEQTRPHFVVAPTTPLLTAEAPVDLSKYIFSGRGLELAFSTASPKISIDNGIVSYAQSVAAPDTVTVSVREGSLTPPYSLRVALAPVTFTDDGMKTEVNVTLLSFDDSNIKIRLSSPVDLTAANFALYNVTKGSPVAIASVGKRGQEYTLEADLPVGANYSLTIEKDGYYFGAPLPLAKMGGTASAEPIDREALVKRHTVHLDKLSSDEIPQVGNGKIAFSIDATGLQTFYGNTMSDWSWHTVPCPPELYAGFSKPHDALKLREYSYNGRKLALRTTSSNQTALYNWMRENPHRFNLGRLRFLLTKSNGTQISASDVKDVDQTLDLWRGVIISRYTIDGVQVEVETCVEPASGALAVRVASPLIAAGRLKIEWAFPYGHHGISGADWANPTKHTSVLSKKDNRLEVARKMDDTQYHAVLAYESAAALSEPSAHTLVLTPDNQSNEFAFTVHYSPEYSEGTPAVDDAFAASEEGWETFWRSGGAVDLSESSDERWRELERRIVLSQYLLAVNNAGSLPPQESGFFSNTGDWSGKFHLEMHWWHSAHYALWGRFPLFEPSLQYYRNALPKARELAQSQGFKGARFVKMSGPDNEDAPSFTGPLIIWQQPHPIFYAVLEYRTNPSLEVLEKWKDVVQETADFMADFAYYDAATDRYVLGPPVATVPENTDYATSKNPAFELSYWHTGLRWAQIWRQRLGLEREEHWDEVMEKLSRLPVQDSLYLQQEGMSNTYTGMSYEHPSLIGPGGMLPYDLADRKIVKRTVGKVWDVWQWDRCWGWDFPMMAMAAARNGLQSVAIDALLHPSTKNAMNRVGLSSGGPFPYYPANGGLLYAVALMAAGWDDAPDIPAPGFPNDGTSWKVRYEGLTRAPENFDPPIVDTPIDEPPVDEPPIDEPPTDVRSVAAPAGSRIIVYPNPARQTVSVWSEFPVRSLQIFSLQGVNVLNGVEVKREVDVSALPDGIYLMKIETDRDIVMKKILIGRKLYQ